MTFGALVHEKSLQPVGYLSLADDAITSERGGDCVTVQDVPGIFLMPMICVQSGSKADFDLTLALICFQARLFRLTI